MARVTVARAERAKSVYSGGERDAREGAACRFDEAPPRAQRSAGTLLELRIATPTLVLLAALVFTTGAGAALPAGSYKIVFDNRDNPERLVNFPVLVVLDSTRMTMRDFDAKGSDLEFVDSDGRTILAHEVESFSRIGLSAIWVDVPAIEPGTDEDFIWLRPAAAPRTTEPSMVWSREFAAVWHMNTELTDSTRNRLAGVNHGTGDVAGKIGRAREFTGRDDHIQIPNSAARGHPLDFSGGKPLTFSAWVFPAGTGPTQAGAGALSGTLVAKRYSTRINGKFDLYVQYQFAVHAHGQPTADNLTELWRLRQSWGGAPTSGYSEYLTSTRFTRGDWYHVTIVCDDWHQPRLYVNGVRYNGSFSHQIEDRSVTNPYVAADVTLGGYWLYRDEEHTKKELAYGVNGMLDEVRMESVARSEAWVKAQYRSQSNQFVRIERQ